MTCLVTHAPHTVPFIKIALIYSAQPFLLADMYS